VAVKSGCQKWLAKVAGKSGCQNEVKIDNGVVVCCCWSLSVLPYKPTVSPYKFLVKMNSLLNKKKLKYF